MSEHDNDADRDLEAFLNRQSPISDAWRKAGEAERAPTALDAAILAAAAEARPLPAARPVRRRWRVPIGLAASVLLGVGVLREAQRDDRLREQVLGEQAAVQARAAEAAQRYQRGQRVDGRMYRADAALAASSQARDEAERVVEQKAAAKAEPAPPPPPPPPAPPKQRTLPAPAADEQPYPFPSAPAEALSAPAPEISVSASKRFDAASAPPQAEAAKPAGLAAVGWQPASYGDLRLGMATVDEVLRRYGAPEVDTATRSNQALLPDGRLAHRLLDYGRKRDRRGHLRLYFDANSEALASANLVLDPPLSLAAVQEAERLVGSGIARAADAPPCDAEPRPPADPPWPQIQSWPGQGVQLLLAGPDRVVEITWLERCH